MSRKRKLRFVWIDDRPEREPMAENLGKTVNASVMFIDVKGKDVGAVLESLLSTKEQPNLLIIDHVLDKTSGASMTRTGSTMAEAVRAKWPQCPVIGVTAARKRKNVNVLKESRYDHLFQAERIKDHVHCIRSTAEGFSQIVALLTPTIEAIIELIGVPDEDRPAFIRSLPDDLLTDLSDDSLATRLHAWMRDALFGRPGFLYDRLWAATIIGLNERGFRKVEGLFREARYDGVFDSPERERWWRGRIKEILYQLCPSDGKQLPWELGRKLDGITRSDLSRCYASGESLPETVAYVDVHSSERHAMRLRYTVPHPEYPALLYFEEVRVMGEGE